MAGQAIILILCSAFMHAGWNLLIRRHRESAAVRRMLLVVALAGLVPAAVSEALTRSLTPRAWACVLGAGAFCGVYYLGLLRAYKSSDFTVVYPVARAVPVLLLALIDVLRGRSPTPVGWVGLSLVAGGCLLAPLHSFRGFALRRYFNRASLWIVLAALGTVGYTLLDKLAAESVRRSPATAARYGYVYFVMSLLVYWALSALFRPAEAEPPRRTGWRLPALAACLNFGGYWLVLYTYQIVARAGYVVAFRQFSIVVGVVLAFAIYKEAGRGVRLTGTGAILAGLVLIALWGG